MEKGQWFTDPLGCLYIVVDDHDTFANLLTWFAVEEVCRFEVELGEED